MLPPKTRMKRYMSSETISHYQEQPCIIFSYYHAQEFHMSLRDIWLDVSQEFGF